MRQVPVFQLAPKVSLVLASGSPRRKELLASLGVDFSIFIPKNSEPVPASGQSPADFARLAAQCKGRAALRQFASVDRMIILAADTIVCMDSRIFGKPANIAEAMTTLSLLNGRTHKVITAFHLTLPKKFAASLSLPTLSSQSTDFPCASTHMEILSHAESDVTFAAWPAEVIEAYARSGEGADKAGAYAIQGQGAFLVSSISGSWTNVVGLPLTPIVHILLKAGLFLPSRNALAVFSARSDKLKIPQQIEIDFPFS